MQDFLAAIQAISVANGYKRDLAAVTRFSLPSIDQQLNATIEIKAGPDGRRDGPLGVEARTLVIRTLAKIRHAQLDDGLTTDAVLIEHEEDIYRAALTDPTRGGLAEDTRWISTDEEESDEPGVRVVLAVNLEVDYRHQLGDMTG